MDNVIEAVKGYKFQIDCIKNNLSKIHNEIYLKQDEIQDLEEEIKDLQEEIYILEDAEESQELQLEALELQIDKVLKLNKDEYSESQISELLYGPDTQTLKLFPIEDLEESLI